MGDSIIELNMAESEIFELMKIAHERDITLNQLVNSILRDACEEKLGIEDISCTHSSNT